MKDYSEFIIDEHGFITSIKPNLETKTIEVMTSKSKKGEPHVYELNKQNIQKLYGRLEKQYKLLIENKQYILENLELQREKKHKIIDIVGLGLSGILLLTAFIATGLDFLFVVGLLPGVGTITTTIISKSKFRKDFNDMIETYDYFMNNKEEIESLAKTDENITSIISVDSHNKLKKSEQLLDEKLTDEQYTIQLIDTLSLKDLKEISLRYKISKALDAEPYFNIECVELIREVVPNEEAYESFFEREESPVVKSKYDLSESEENNQVQNQHHAKSLHK